MASVRSAEEAVGRDDEASDWKLRPDHHAEHLPIDAGALRRVLMRPEIGTIMQHYTASDRAAVAAQARYKRIGRLGLYAATVATVVGAAFLLPIESLVSAVRPYVSAVQITALVVAFLASRWLVSAKPFDTWMKQRGTAEIARASLFDTVARAQEPLAPGELALLPLKLEYFRRYQLDVQRRYYRGRGAQHQAAVWRNNKWLTASFVTTAAAVVVGTIVALHLAKAYVELPSWLVDFLALMSPLDLNRTILALGVVASGFYGLGVARSLMDLDERNASRFQTVAANLEYLTETGLAKARAAADANNEAEVLDFVDGVQQQISSEHREWVILANLEHDPDKMVYATARR